MKGTGVDQSPTDVSQTIEASAVANRNIITFLLVRDCTVILGHAGPHQKGP